MKLACFRLIIFAFCVSSAQASTLLNSVTSTELQAFQNDLGVSPESIESLQQNLNVQEIADDIEPELFTREPRLVGETKLQLIGKGFREKGDDGDSIVLACSGKLDPETKTRECNIFRHVYFDHVTQKAWFVGETHVAFGNGQQMNQKELKREIKEIDKDFKKYKRSAHHNRNFWIFGIGGIGGVLGIWLSCPASWGVAAAGGLPLTTAVGMGYIITWAIIGSIYNNHGTFLAGSAGSSTAFYDQNGWNWVTKPKEVSHETMKLYREFLRISVDEKAPIGFDNLRF